MGRPATHGEPCTLCKARKSRRANGLCDACNTLTDVEGTKKKLGVPTQTPTRQRWEQQAAEYNKLVLEGFTQKQIAEKWNIEVQSLRALVFRVKSRGGIAIVNLGNGRGNIRETLSPSIEIRSGRNGHGGGRWGVRGCKCTPCKEVSAASRKVQAQKRAQVLKEKLARLAELEANQS